MRSRDELIRDVLLWILTHGRAKAGWPARTYIQQLCEDTGCCPEDLPRAMNDREEWRERLRDIRAASTIWWWWYIYIISIIEFWCLKLWLFCRYIISVKFESSCFWSLHKPLPTSLKKSTQHKYFSFWGLILKSSQPNQESFLFFLIFKLIGVYT